MAWWIGSRSQVQGHGNKHIAAVLGANSSDGRVNIFFTFLYFLIREKILASGNQIQIGSRRLYWPVKE